MKNKKFLAIFTLPLLLSSCIGKVELDGEITRSKVNKFLDRASYSLSEVTYNSYSSFAKKFAKLALNSMEKEESVGVSIPDAYLAFSICALISNDVAREDVLNYLELEDIEELKLATSEIIKAFCSLSKNNDGQYVGGYNLNSLWFNPGKVSLLEDRDVDVYNALEEVFDANTYYSALTSKKANDFLKAYGLKDKPTPKIKLDDEDPAAVSIMSVYYLLDYFKEETKQYYENQYRSGTHKMEYNFGSETKQVDYIESSSRSSLLLGDNFKGATQIINSLSMTYFLPDDKTALPSSIMDDVLNEKYQEDEYLLEVPYDDYSFYTKDYDITIEAPYFSLDNKIDIKYEDLIKILPVITKGGAARRMCDPRYELGFIDIFLSYIKQFSVMKFNYDGFYSCSVTIMGMDAGSAAPLEYRTYDLRLDHPYVFEVNKSVRVGDSSFKNVPLIIGEIIDPNYVD